MARRPTIALPSTCGGWMGMSPRCPLGPRPRGVSAPGWGATAARRAGKRDGARPATPGKFFRRRCGGVRRRRCPPCKRPSARWQPPGLDTRAPPADCASPRWGLWHDRDPALAAPSGVASRGKDQPLRAGVEVVPGPGAVAAHLQLWTRGCRRVASPSLLSSHAPVGRVQEACG
jgi:hypothetical protein